MRFKDMVNEGLADTLQRQVDTAQAERDRLNRQQEALTKRLEANAAKMERLNDQLAKAREREGVVTAKPSTPTA